MDGINNEFNLTQNNPKIAELLKQAIYITNFMENFPTNTISFNNDFQFELIQSQSPVRNQILFN